jgi:hypothetical protein
MVLTKVVFMFEAAGVAAGDFGDLVLGVLAAGRFSASDFLLTAIGKLLGT